MSSEERVWFILVDMERDLGGVVWCGALACRRVCLVVCFGIMRCCSVGNIFFGARTFGVMRGERGEGSLNEARG